MPYGHIKIKLIFTKLPVEQGIGYALTFNIRGTGNICFRPFYSVLESGVGIVWKKNQILFPAAKVFLNAIEKQSAPS